MKTKKVPVDPAKDAKTYPYMVVKRYQDPRYYRSWKEARSAVVKELTDLRDRFDLFGWADSVAACNVVLKQAGELWPERGAMVGGLVDPETGQRYVCELVKREQL